MLFAHQLLLYKVTYIGMVFLLAGTGLVLPFPEEVVLLTAGYLCAEGLMQLFIALPLAIAGVLAGDSILFALAKAGSPYAEKLREKVRRLQLKRTWVFSPDHPLRAVFFLRFVTGLRMLSPIYAGFHQATWRGFLFTTLGALLIFVPVMFGIGYYFNDSLSHVLRGFAVYRHVLFVGFLVLVSGGTLIALYYYSKRDPLA